MSKFDHIRPFYDTEVNQAIRGIVDDPMMKAIMNFTFPAMEESEWKRQLNRTHSIRDFQINFIYPAIEMVLKRSSEGLSYSGLDQLDQHVPYLFISNHRDIILDTSLLNYVLYNNGLMMTSSAIGDNLVKRPLLKTLSKLTRNFMVQRGLSSRELLESSKLMSEYIQDLLFHENRSVWIAQREGRTKDGNDATQKGVLKMISMARGEVGEMEYFKNIHIVPVSISYEYDPTDVLKMPELMAKSRSEVYVKHENEDFNTILNGIMGQKKHIHVHVDKPLDDEIDKIIKTGESPNKQLQYLSEVIDEKIIGNYKLWPTNYIAHDLLHNSQQFADEYSALERDQFQERMKEGIDLRDELAVKNFLSMYANPVTNQEALKVKE
ncbi:1-acyl-sn-glycerol-3-phosphate acyltransferase [Echinicola vietnamensis]|uniref:1-acyl-sn-glycerol-3-phosphate acyltransferase n=1 Tax=Echinicola vietnamensis (strain DSM 17526 / LMG 23754 / KMM 6221) TaxID=926556 RepID=L0FZ20_ECHVK|nr:1-acyl-sn-glycerol-3-phosphate acyltransferase [Echinicola vietnamensis]AGA78522.1 1-acyl-sn-glycerol-3-phosphate acyltransferase [Echinicola vietnamensis DSM 17526]